ncbi:MAG TPA: PAS domain S-box protein [Burkholderiales bacterium]|nr:PAS domain S-box protein [Burkholderiales bacterium]
MELAILGGVAALGVIFAVMLLAARRAALTGRDALREQVRFSSDVFDSLPIGLAMRDLEGRYVFVNRAWEEFVGAKREDVIGKTVHDRTNREVADVIMADDRKALAGGPGKASELQDLVHRGRHFMLTRSVIANVKGELLGVLVASVDTTERQAMEQALRDQAKFTDDLIDSLPVALAMRDHEGRYLFVNHTWEKLFGDVRARVVGQRLHERVSRQTADEVMALDREAAERGPDAIVTRDFLFGERHLMQTRRLMTDGAGKPRGVLIASSDTTDRYTMQEALAEEQMRFELVVRAARLGIVDWDGVRRVAWYSPRFKEILRYPADADTSQWPDYWSMVHPEDRERVQGRFRAHVQDRDDELHETIEYRLRRADGGYVWIEASGASVRDANGFVTRFIASIEDISERRFQDEQLRNAVRLREEVERMSRHDLKTPLNSVIAMARLLREGRQLAREDDQLLGSIERAGYRVLNMVNLSLDLFRMEQGSYEFRPRAVDLAAVARRVAEDLERQAQSKGVTVDVRAAGRTIAYGEELLCYSMLANLVKNAIEAAPDASVVSVTFEAVDEVLFTRVHNDGAVPDDMRPRFFQKYATFGKSGGMGLGAYSARLMARVQQGEAKLETSFENGTTVTVSLGLAAQPSPLEEKNTEQGNGVSVHPAKTSASRRVLIVDDDEFNRLVFRRSLPQPPFQVEEAVNGRAALEAARRAWPDAVLLDLEMPVMDGFEAARRLRDMGREGQRGRCVIIAISSNDEAAVVERALAAGCDHYLVKPAPREALLKLLDADAVSLDPDLRASLPAFLASRRKMLDELPEALAGADRARFRRVAHKLAGSFSLYGFAWAAAQCRELERAAEQGDAAELTKRAAAVRAHLDTVNVA